MSTVTNVDGTYQADSPYDHCRHGVYVGGCGFDFMCGACEMGDPDLTVRQAQARVMVEAVEVWDLYDELYRLRLERGVDDARQDVDDLFDRLLGNGTFRTLERACEVRDRIVELADGPDDDDYLRRRHDAECDAWRRQERQEYLHGAIDAAACVENGTLHEQTPNALRGLPSDSAYRRGWLDAATERVDVDAELARR